MLTVIVEYLGVGHLFGRGNHCQGFVGGAAVVEHHGGFDGVVDRAGDQVQVVVGIHPQRQHAEYGQ
ncbi:hypothetical protein D3C80_2198210 [compost metagenome]